MQSLQNIIEDANIPGLQLTYINNGKEVNYVVVAGDKYGGKPNTTVCSRQRSTGLRVELFIHSLRVPAKMRTLSEER